MNGTSHQLRYRATAAALSEPTVTMQISGPSAATSTETGARSRMTVAGAARRCSRRCIALAIACRVSLATGVLRTGIATALCASVASRGRNWEGSIAMILLSARIAAVATSGPTTAADEVNPSAIAITSSSLRLGAQTRNDGWQSAEGVIDRECVKVVTNVDQ
jgi:hypothetical protein